MINRIVIVLSFLHFSILSVLFWCSHGVMAYCGLLLVIFAEVYLLSATQLANNDLKAKCAALNERIQEQIEEVGEGALDTARNSRWYTATAILEFFQNHRAYTMFILPDETEIGIIRNGGICKKIIEVFMTLTQRTPFPFSYVTALLAIPAVFTAEVIQYRMLKRSGQILWDTFRYLTKKRG